MSCQLVGVGAVVAADATSPYLELLVFDSVESCCIDQLLRDV